ncbi:3-oxoacyl-[acyl-carrier protein] reductase [Alteribacillus persepolensis]|uniref:3-oxoacyl-[acyl-carrier protein] reductase n=1 Tax=Alteribacillus persepolensis TaxID=568899 RepID=A0A1G8CD36_9BACI|nr:SDR family oxidoreductase [Alteribacillus persepolensis]SDH43335.1 3-oxoacyl-[acyl-carrier protein] reductase [Alteribacillus persepolensis]
MELGLEQKKVLVTGGSKGIGKGIASLFLDEGAEVAIVARSKEGLEQAQKELPGVKMIQADVTKEAARVQAFEKFQQTFGTVDVLVNNAGKSDGRNVEETALGEFESAMNMNYLSAVHFSKIAYDVMKQKQAGSIVNISSIYGREAGGKPSYNNSKAALISFTKAFADEAIKNGVRVNSVAPGAILHPNGNWQKRLQENPEKINQFVEREIPGGRFGTVEEIANVVVFLASAKASWVNGASVNVDGGQSRMNM